MAQQLRIFVSSPSDVPNERLRADLIADKLSQEYSRFFTVESYRWEHEPMLASGHFQDAVEPPSTFDIVVMILWSRLGVPLPQETAVRKYRGIDGRAPVTGTEWEYEEALRAAREKKAPDLLAFRNVSPAPVDTRDSEARARSNEQLDALDRFWRQHFSDRGVFLAAYDEYRTLEEFAEKLEQKLRKLIDRRIKDSSGVVTGPEPIWLDDPFRGLESYEFEQAPVFFGRDTAITRGTERLAANARAGKALLLVCGPSGSGKSSLVKAGIAPRLMKPQRISGLSFLRRAVFRAGADGGDIILGLARALTLAAGEDVGLPELIAPGQDAAQLAGHLRGAAGEPGYLFGNALGRLTAAARQSGRILAYEEARLILIVDQLEELFTSTTIVPEDRILFFQILSGLARSAVVWVIATLRADFWHRAAEIKEFVALVEGQGRIDLAAPSQAELAEMIRRPAQAAELSFETHRDSGLSLDVVLAEHAAAAPGALPLLSFMLDELYKAAKARGESVLTYASYESLGGLEGAIAKRADEIMVHLPATAQAALPRVLRSLTTVTGGGADWAPVARSAQLEAFAAGSPALTLINTFIVARLLVAASPGGGAPIVRLAHEALISRWKRARDQLAADHRDLETRAFVERQFRRWSATRGAARRLLLLRNPDLANAVDLAKRWGDELEVQVRDFINLSARRARLVQTLTAAAAVLFAIVAGVAVYAEQRAIGQSTEATKQRYFAEIRETEVEHQLRAAQIAQSRYLLQDARTSLEKEDYGTAALLALEGLPEPGAKQSRPIVRGLAPVLYEALLRLRERLDIVNPHNWGGEQGLIFSPDGRLAIVVDDRNARLLEVESGKEITVLRGHTASVLAAGFSPDGTLIATASADKTARVWDARTGKAIAGPLRHDGEIRQVVFSPDARLVLTGSADKTVRLWDSRSGEMIGAPLKGHVGKILDVAFSPNGQRIVTASADKTARIWDVESGRLIGNPLIGHQGGVLRARFTPDNRRVLTASADRTVRVWDADTSQQIGGPITGQNGWSDITQFSDDGKWALTPESDYAAGLWDVASGKKTGVLNLPEIPYGQLIGASFSRDGTLVVTRSLETRLWQTAGAKLIAVLKSPEQEDQVANAPFSPDGSHLATVLNNSNWARIWDAATVEPVTKLSGHSDQVRRAVFSPNGRIVATGSLDGTIRLWTAATGEPVGKPLEGHAGSIWSVEFSGAGDRIVTASSDKTARIWNAGSGTAIGGPLTGHEAKVTRAAFSPDGKLVVTASDDKTARIWDAGSDSEIHVLRGHTAGVIGASFSPDGRRILTWSDDKTARIWDAESGKQVAIMSGHDNAVWDASFSPSGDRVATASEDTTARIWDSATGKELVRLVGHRQGEGEFGGIASVRFSSDGKRVVTASADKTAQMWDAQTGKMIFVLQGHQSIVDGAIFSPDGKLVATTSYDGTARLWDVETGDEMAVLSGHEGFLLSAAFSADGKSLVTAGNDKTARLWRLLPSTTIPELVRTAIARMPRCLTADQRDAYSLEIEPPDWCYNDSKPPYKPRRYGFSYAKVDDARAQYLRSSKAEGLVVTRVLTKSAAEGSGLLLNDILLAADGKTLQEEHDLSEALEHVPASGSLHLKGLRNREALELELRPQN